MQFSYYNPTRIQFGAGQIAAIAKLIPAGKRTGFWLGYNRKTASSDPLKVLE